MPRPKAIKKFNLSDHTLEVNIRKCNYEKFNFSEIEDYVRALVGSRDYQYEAIKEVMIYLWGGGYENIEELAKENWKTKYQIQHRFGTEENFLRHLPLADRLSGVVHMATGTGKSFVIFAIAYLSLIMGLTKRVLVLGPSSTIIEQGLRDKFKDLMVNPELTDKLPQKYQGKAISLLTDNDPIEDYSIVIENINATWTFGSIQDTLFSNSDDVLVLGDEIHHAYSHLKYTNDTVDLDFEEGKEGTGETRNERLWMQFLKKHKEIKRHIGFTGTPYNQDEYFADIIVNYSIKDAIEERYIKEINPILHTDIEEGFAKLTLDQRFEMILENHEKNKKDYSYGGLVKPITVFICPDTKNAEKRYNEFIDFLAKHEKSKHPGGADSAIRETMSRKAICVTSKIAKSEYKEQLDNIEERNPEKVGGNVEFIFAVNKLSEGWDVENVFQIVPMEERVFNSKLLISQVLGRGLRIPRKVPIAKIQSNYPVVTVTNHDKFADHIKELVDAVTQSDMYLNSSIIPTSDGGRGKHNFTLFNLNYLPSVRFEEVKKSSQGAPKQLILTPFEEKLGVSVIRRLDNQKYKLERNFSTIDEIVYEIHNRFKYKTFEEMHFDFGEVVVEDRYPSEEEIKTVIVKAMEEAGIEGNKLSDENKKQINIFFNQFFTKGTKKRIFENVEGDLVPISTELMEKRSIRISALENDGTAFLSEDNDEELNQDNKFAFEYIEQMRKKNKDEDQMALFKADEFVTLHDEFIRTYVKSDTRSPYVVNTSLFKAPQDIVLVSHSPEKEFVYTLIKNANFIDAWIKSPDKNFYGIDYEYWRKGKDRVRRSFNPDFFIKIDLDRYIQNVEAEGYDTNLTTLRDLQDEGVKTIIKVVEIKSDDDDDEATPKKEEWAMDHFKRLNERLKKQNAGDIEEKYRSELRQHYVFSLLTPKSYDTWIFDLKRGKLK